jgi:hypothetical protein
MSSAAESTIRLRVAAPREVSFGRDAPVDGGGIAQL